MDRSFGLRVAAAAAQFHLWVVESAGNTPAVPGVWAERGMDDDEEDPLGVGVTSFAAGASESAESRCARIAELVDEHHGAHAHDPAWSEIEVFGVSLSERLRTAFERIGATTFESTTEGFVCRR